MRFGYLLAVGPDCARQIVARLQEEEQLFLFVADPPRLLKVEQLDGTWIFYSEVQRGIFASPQLLKSQFVMKN